MKPLSNHDARVAQEQSQTRQKNNKNYYLDLWIRMADWQFPENRKT